MIIDGYRDGPWGWFIYDVCVAGVEGDVHHASARRFRELMTQAGLKAVAQRSFHGPAPFLITEGIAAEPVPVVPAPHFRVRVPATRASPRRSVIRDVHPRGLSQSIRRTEHVRIAL